ncbi:hypothetical protein QL285_054158 [Trifolium repens]|jgi:hypothetical protein|nr:hypothetical protein QL285_054158 [Trifolium repens]
MLHRFSKKMGKDRRVVERNVSKKSLGKKHGKKVAGASSNTKNSQIATSVSFKESPLNLSISHSVSNNYDTKVHRRLAYSTQLW